MTRLWFIFLVTSLARAESTALLGPTPLLVNVNLRQIESRNCDALLRKDYNATVPIQLCLSEKSDQFGLRGSRTLIYERGLGQVEFEFSKGLCLMSERWQSIKSVTVPECRNISDIPINTSTTTIQSHYPYIVLPIASSCEIRLELSWREGIPNIHSWQPCPAYPGLTVQQFLPETHDQNQTLESNVRKILRLTILKLGNASIDALEYYLSCWNATSEVGLVCLRSLLSSDEDEESKHELTTKEPIKDASHNERNQGTVDINWSFLVFAVMFVFIIILLIFFFVRNFKKSRETR